MPPKICPECGEEYVHVASVCIHCDVPLVLEGEVPVESAAEALPPASELVCVRASSVGWAMSLSEHLVEAGIPHRIQAATSDADEGEQRKPGQNLPYGVRGSDRPRPYWLSDTRCTRGLWSIGDQCGRLPGLRRVDCTDRDRMPRLRSRVVASRMTQLSIRQALLDVNSKSVGHLGLS